MDRRARHQKVNGLWTEAVPGRLGLCCSCGADDGCGRPKEASGKDFGFMLCKDTGVPRKYRYAAVWRGMKMGGWFSGCLGAERPEGFWPTLPKSSYPILMRCGTVELLRCERKTWKNPRTIRLQTSQRSCAPQPVYPANEDCTSKVIRQPCGSAPRSWSLGHQLVRELAYVDLCTFGRDPAFIRRILTMKCSWRYALLFVSPTITGVFLRTKATARK